MSIFIRILEILNIKSNFKINEIKIKIKIKIK